MPGKSRDIGGSTKNSVELGGEDGRARREFGLQGEGGGIFKQYNAFSITPHLRNI